MNDSRLLLQEFHTLLGYLDPTVNGNPRTYSLPMTDLYRKSLLRRIEAELRDPVASEAAPSGKPVAWRCKDPARGWVYYEEFPRYTEWYAEPLYASSGSSAAPTWTPPADCVAWPVEKQTLVWAECEHNGEKHRAPFWIAPGTLLAGHPNMLRKAGAVQPKPSDGSYVPQEEK